MPDNRLQVAALRGSAASGHVLCKSTVMGVRTLESSRRTRATPGTYSLTGGRGARAGIRRLAKLTFAKPATVGQGRLPDSCRVQYQLAGKPWVGWTLISWEGEIPCACQQDRLFHLATACYMLWQEMLTHSCWAQTIRLILSGSRTHCCSQYLASVRRAVVWVLPTIWCSSTGHTLGKVEFWLRPFQ
jgi:hypothetical protein